MMMGVTARCATHVLAEAGPLGFRLSFCSAKRATTSHVVLTASFTALGLEGRRALDEIARRRGVTRAEAARQAIAETAERERWCRNLAAEAAALAKDPAKVREAREVETLMEQLRGPRWRSDDHASARSRSCATRTPIRSDRPGGRSPRLSTIVVCPTSTSTPPASFHPEVKVADETTRVMCELVGAVDARMLGKQIVHLTFDEMRSIDDALQLVLDLG